MTNNAESIDQIEALIAEGKWDEAMPLLLALLDAAPSDENALDDLVAAATFFPDRYTDELFARLERAAVSTSGDERRELRWSELAHAIFFGRIERAKEIVKNGEDLIGLSEDRAAQLGALTEALGDHGVGDALLRSRPGALATYHLARLAAAKGAHGDARTQFESLGKEGPSGALGAIGVAALALLAGGADATKSAKAFFEHVENAGEMLPMPVVSEGILLRILVALAEHNHDEAKWHGQRMGAGAAKHDPSALLRATTLLGPLRQLQ